VFLGNVSPGAGGGLVIGTTSATVERCLFTDNIAMNGSAGGLGIGADEFVVRDCVFLRNRCFGNGLGGGANLGGSGVVEGNTFHENTQELVVVGGGAISFYGDHVLRNNIISGSTGAPAVQVNIGAVTSSCNVFWNNSGGNAGGFALDPTDRVVDPLYCDPAADDLTLHLLSPCLPENSLGCGLIGARGLGCGAVSLEPESWARIKSRYRR
jgi:hypothetical protein